MFVRFASAVALLSIARAPLAVMAAPWESVPLTTIPLKPMKYADLGGHLLRVLEDRCRLDSKPVPPAAADAARALGATRERLRAIEKLTPYTYEAAAAEFSKYAAQLANEHRPIPQASAQPNM